MTSVTLPSQCDRSAARSTLTEISDVLGENAVEIDASKVEKIGQAMIQVLLSASQSEGGITISSPSEAFTKGVGYAGLEQQLIGVS